MAADAGTSMDTGVIASTPTAPPEHGPELLYLQSSQARNWRFSARQIEKMRDDGNAAAQTRLRQLWQLERSLPPIQGEPETSSSAQSDPVAFLSVGEEQTLIAYYLARVRQLVKAFGLSEVVEATTLTYIKRFYLRNTCMDYHPKNVMLTCLFLSAKAENNAVPLRHFATKLAGKMPSEAAVQEYVKTVQDLEFFVSQSLSFEYTVHGAHRALHGLFLDVQSACQPKPSHDMLSAILTASRATLQRSRFTDVELIYTPSQIALACMASVSDDAKAMVMEYLKKKETRAHTAQQQAETQRNEWRASERARLERRGARSDSIPAALKDHRHDDIASTGTGMTTNEIGALLSDIMEMIEEQQKTRATDNVETIREIDRRLKVCQNPEKMSESRITHKRLIDQADAVKLGKRSARNSASLAASAKENGDEDDDDDEEDVENLAPNKRLKAE